MEPGTERTFDIMLGNKSDGETVKMRASIAPVTQIANGQYNLSPEAGKWSAGPWLSLKTETVTLKPRDQELVTVKVKLPRGATGSRTAAVVFDVLPARGRRPARLARRLGILRPSADDDREDHGQKPGQQAGCLHQGLRGDLPHGQTRRRLRAERHGRRLCRGQRRRHHLKRPGAAHRPERRR